MTDPCRTGYCQRPLVACDCVPFLGWWHPGDDPATDHMLGSHFCNAGQWAEPPRVAEPEPPPLLTLDRIMAALPHMPEASLPPGSDWGAAITARRAETRWCAFCLVAAPYVITFKAPELMVDGVKWLDLCDPHFADIRRHSGMWTGRDAITAWERHHGRQARTG